jgi:hypothetical protein
MHLEVQVDHQFFPNEVEDIVLLDLLEFLDIPLPEGQLHLKHLRRGDRPEIARAELAVPYLTPFRVQTNRYLSLTPRKPLAEIPLIPPVVSFGQILMLRLQDAGPRHLSFHNPREQNHILVDLVLPVCDELAGAKCAFGEEVVSEEEILDEQTFGEVEFVDFAEIGLVAKDSGEYCHGLPDILQIGLHLFLLGE